MSIPRLAAARAALRRREERRREIDEAERARAWSLVRLALKLAVLAVVLAFFCFAGFLVGEVA